jgi:hypothetical protein
MSRRLHQACREVPVMGTKKAWVKPELTVLNLNDREIEVLFPEAKDRFSKRGYEKRQGRAA